MKEIPSDYFIDLDDEMLQFIEEQSEKSMKETITANNYIQNKADGLFKLLLMGVGSTFLLIMNNANLRVDARIGLSVLVFLWTAIACYLWWSTMKPSQRIGFWHTPRQLYSSFYKNEFEEYSVELSQIGLKNYSRLDVLRRGSLPGQELMHTLLLERNTKRAKHLNLAMIASVSAPVISGFFVLVLYFVVPQNLGILLP